MRACMRESMLVARAVAPRLAPCLPTRRASASILATSSADADDGGTQPEPPMRTSSASFYDADELAALFEVHSEFFGERCNDADEEAAGEVSGFGGLHEAILRTLESDAAEPPEAPPPPLQSPPPP